MITTFYCLDCNRLLVLSATFLLGSGHSLLTSRTKAYLLWWSPIVDNQPSFRHAAGVSSRYLALTAEVFDIIASFGLTGHSYADNTQAAHQCPTVCWCQLVWLNVWSNSLHGCRGTASNWTPTRLNWCSLELGSSWTSWPSCNFRFVRQQSTWYQLQQTFELFWTVSWP